VVDASSDARSQAVDARLTLVEARVTHLGDRVNELEQQVQSHARRFDATRTQIDHVQLQLSALIDHRYRELGRRLLLSVLGITVATAGLCLGTVLLAL
jgi:hypothetical protein